VRRKGGAADLMSPKKEGYQMTKRRRKEKFPFGGKTGTSTQEVADGRGILSSREQDHEKKGKIRGLSPGKRIDVNIKDDKNS